MNMTDTLRKREKQAVIDLENNGLPNLFLETNVPE